MQASAKRDAPGKQRNVSGRLGRNWLIAVGGGALVLVVIVVAALALSGGDGGGTASAEVLEAGGCVATDEPSQGQEHVPESPEILSYNTFPPTSGPHFAVPAIWNSYTASVEQFRLVHNLEHGGVVVQYGEDVPPEQTQAVIGWYQTSPDGILVAPLPELGSAIALTAWTHLLTCSDGFDEAAFTEFRDAYRFNGPENLPPETYAPGFDTGFMQQTGQ